MHTCTHSFRVLFVAMSFFFFCVRLISLCVFVSSAFTDIQWIPSDFLNEFRPAVFLFLSLYLPSEREWARIVFICWMACSACIRILLSNSDMPLYSDVTIALMLSVQLFGRRTKIEWIWIWSNLTTFAGDLSLPNRKQLLLCFVLAAIISKQSFK